MPATGSTLTAPHRRRPPRRPGTTAPPARRDLRRPAPGRTPNPAPNPAPGRAPAAGPGPAPRTAPGAATRPPAVPAVPAAGEREPHRWFADRLLDVLTGRHPVSRMLGLTTGPGVYERVWELAVGGALRPPAGRPTPRVRRCGFRRPVPEAREVWAVVSCGEALRALAFRLEQGSGDRRWRCAALDFTGPGW